jgi:hypothetical protein
MRFPKFFFISVLLIAAAVFSQVTALRFAAAATRLLGKVEHSQNPESVRATRVALDSKARISYRVGLACAVLSAISLLISRRLAEPAPRVLLLIAFAIYWFLHFAVV